MSELGAGRDTPWDAWHRTRHTLEWDSGPPYVNPGRELALRHMGPIEGLSVLDCGSARGAFSRTLADRGARVTAVDSSAVAVELTRRQLAGAGEVVQADARRLPFPDRHFDVVLCLQTLNYVRPAEALVSELVRVAKPGARIVVTALNYRSTLGLSRVVLASLGRNSRPPGEVGLATNRVLRLLRARGVVVDAVDGDGYAVVVPGVTTVSVPWLRRVPRAERIAFHVCVAGLVP